MAESIPDLQYSIRLVKKNQHYYFHIPLRDTAPVSIIQDRHECLSIDPGIRVMLSCYDPTGIAIEFGTRDGWQHIVRKQHSLDALMRKYQTTKRSRDRMRIRTRIRALYRRISNCINDLHHKVSKWILERYENVYIPAFGVSDMNRKVSLRGKKRVYGRKMARQLITWGHFQFRELLKAKAERYNTQVHVCTEEYTSMTCSKCGRLNRDLGRSKVFKCPHKDCGHDCDRDLNAARNILLMNYRV